MAESAALLVDEVLPEQPTRQWVLSFPFQLRLLFASRPEIMDRVLGIVYRVVATHLVKKAGYTKKSAQTGAVTLIQRFGSALNLNIHFHMLFLDGVYVERPDGAVRFRWVTAPTTEEPTQLAHIIAHRVGRFLEREGLLERDAENSYLSGDAVDDDPMSQLCGRSITYRIAVGPQAGRKVFAPISKHRALVTPAKRGKGSKLKAPDEAQYQALAERRASMTWAQRLKRVFNIDVSVCPKCGCEAKVIACIEDPGVIKKILEHLKQKGGIQEAVKRSVCRGPPQIGLFD